MTQDLTRVDSDPELDPTGRQRTPDWPLMVFVVVLTLSCAYLLFGPPAREWFAMDEWGSLVETPQRPVGLIDDWNGHWIALPYLAYRALFLAFGLTTHTPYLALGVIGHAAVVIMVRAVARRAGAGPWSATLAAICLLWFGPGSDNILNGFQIAFTGALAFGFLHLLCATPVGAGWNRRDWVGLAAGAAGLLCSAVSISMLAVVGVAVLLSRGWRAALAHTVPLAAAFAAWRVLADVSANPASPQAALADWVGVTLWTTIDTLAGFGWLGTTALIAFLVAGVTVQWFDRDTPTRLVLAVPAGLSAGVLVLCLSTYASRAPFGLAAATASRYLYLVAALILPIGALAATALMRRNRIFVVVPVILLAAIPSNAAAVQPPPLKAAAIDQPALFAAIAQSPLTEQVPAWVRPRPEIPGVTVAWIRSAYDAGILPQPGDETAGENEVRLALGLAQRPGKPVDEGDCHGLAAGDEWQVAPESGDTFTFTNPEGTFGSNLTATLSGGGAPSASHTFDSVSGGGPVLAVTLPLLDLTFTAPPDTPGVVTVCRLTAQGSR